MSHGHAIDEPRRPRAAGGPEVTVVVSPRDHFFHTRVALERLFSNTPQDFRLLYVLHSAPPAVEAYVEHESRSRGFDVVRSPHVLTPNEARNLGLARVDTPFVVFLDNDAVVAPGWLEGLLGAAKRTEAWIAGPTYFFGMPEQECIHMAGGSLRIEAGPGGPRLHEIHHLGHRSVAQAGDALHSGPVDFVEFHCLLARTGIFDRLGPLDEALMSQGEHVDLCLAATRAGGLVHHEAMSRVGFLMPPPISTEELPYYLLRWSDDWNAASVDRLIAKWGLPRDPLYREQVLHWSRLWRRRVLRQVAWPLGRIGELTVYREGTRRIGEGVVGRIERHATRSLLRARDRARAA